MSNHLGHSYGCPCPNCGKPIWKHGSPDHVWKSDAVACANALRERRDAAELVALRKVRDAAQAVTNQWFDNAGAGLNFGTHDRLKEALEEARKVSGP